MEQAPAIPGETQGVAAPGAGIAGALPGSDPKASVHQNLEQLDESLSELTSLMLGGEGEAELDGEFEPPPAIAETGRAPAPAPSPAEAAVESAQAAVAAAMESVAGQLEQGAVEPQGQGAAGPDEVSASLGAAAESIQTVDSAKVTETAVADTVEAAVGAPEERLPEQPGDLAPTPEVGGLADDAESTVAGMPAGTAPSPDPGPGGDPGAPEEEAKTIPNATGPAPEPLAPAAPAQGAPVVTAAAPVGVSVASADARAHTNRSLRGAIGSGLAAMLAAALEPIGDALRARSKAFRQSLAWLALWTAFNAACVWACVLIFRSASHSSGDTPSAEILGGEESPAPGGHEAEH